MSSLDEQLKERILDHYLELGDRGEFVHPPSTDEELDEFISLALQVKVPRKTITPGHGSPFAFISDLFFERVKNALGFANRTGSKTFSVAILNLLDMLFKPGCEITSAGADLKQAEKCYRYFRDFLSMDWSKRLNARYADITGRPLFSDKNTLQSRTLFGNNSRLEVITGSEKGLRGPHPHKARIDEIDLIDWPVLQTGLSMAKSSTTIRGQNVFTSTRQLQYGSMQRLLEEAKDKGIEVYEWNVWEVLDRCDRRCVADPKYGDCPIYTFCKGTAHRCAGYILIDDFIDKVRLLDRTAFDTEWLNKLPSRHKLVYHMLDTRHVMTPERLASITGKDRVDPSWFRLSGLDFGSSPGHPFVYLKLCELPGGRGWLVFHEYIAEQKYIRDHALAIKRSPHYLPSEIIYGDWDVQDRMELRANGVKVRKATKGQGSVLMGIDWVSQLFSGFPPKEEPLLYIWHTCSGTIKELSQYSWPIRPDGTIDKSGNPEKRYDNCSDALRMALFSHKHHGVARYRASNIRGV